VELEDIFRAHQREIFMYLLRTVGDRRLAEDLAQDTFLRACGSAVLFRGEASPRTWLFSIARRALADHYRRRAPEVLLESGSEEPAAIATHDATQRIAVEQVLAALPLAHREAIVLCDVLGFSPAEAAGLTGLTANAYRVRLHRARAQFREVYGDDR
jgi:RNA polymerase sigma-70 factor, ECF subfamily